MKKIIIIITIIIILLSSCACAEEISDHREFYSRLTVVVGSEQIAPNLWIVSCVDRFGNEWEFFAECDEWECGDLCNLLMWHIGEREEEDEIVDVYWEGYIEEDEILLFLQTM